MLDDLNSMKQIDSQDALGVVSKQWQQLQEEFLISHQNVKISNVVFAGMGGSALEALISASWPGYNVPFQIVNDYNIPSYAKAETLLIISSYSGNTEEEISILNEATNKQCRVVTVSSGGKLQEMSARHGYLHVALPAGLQPRHAAFYGFKALVGIMSAFNLSVEQEPVKRLSQASNFLKGQVANWLPSVPKEQNLAKQLALASAGKTPIIYASSKMYPAAYKWKINFNENAKNTAWCGKYPEFNHNEFIGWSSHPVEKPFAVFDLISSFDNERIKKRFELSDRLLSGKRPKAIQIHAEGESFLEQLLWVIQLGDLTSIYLAILNGVNPTPVDLIEKFKLEMANQE